MLHSISIHVFLCSNMFVCGHNANLRYIGSHILTGLLHRNGALVCITKQVYVLWHQRKQILARKNLTLAVKSIIDRPQYGKVLSLLCLNTHYYHEIYTLLSRSINATTRKYIHYHLEGMTRMWKIQRVTYSQCGLENILYGNTLYSIVLRSSVSSSISHSTLNYS